jgi:hypothetical protein
MKCPVCHKEARDPVVFCDYCRNETAIPDAIDGGELRELIEKAWGNAHHGYELISHIKRYCSGRPEPLKKLAGER